MSFDRAHNVDERPNILVIMSDEHDPSITGCYGHRYVKTPHLDRLAADGVTFDRAYCNSPMCGPSRASFLTGKYPHQIGVWDNGSLLKGEIPSFANYLEAGGYDTVLCGRMHMVGENRLHGFGSRLFDDMEDWKFSDQRAARTPEARRKSDSHVTESGPGSGSWQEYDETATDLAEWFLHARGRYQSPKPWFLVCGLMFPHFPLIAPKELYDLYWPDSIEMPSSQERFADQHPVIQQLRLFFRNENDFPEEVTRRALASYYALVTLTDRNVGRLVSAIDNSALRENTIVIYTSDHGEMAGQHGIWQKQCFYEPSVRVPLLVRTPNGPTSKRVAANVSLVDIFPTLLHIAGIPEPGNLAGTSLYDHIHASPAVDGDVFSEYHAQGMVDGGFMIKRNQWKYVYYSGGYQPQLFNLETDLGELQDLAQDPAHREIREQLHRALLEICDPDAVNDQVRASQGAAHSRP